MHTSTTTTLAAIALLGSAVLISALPACNCPSDNSILTSCKDLTLTLNSQNPQRMTVLMASCQDKRGAWKTTALDLDEVLANIHGKFVWGSKYFSHSADGIKFDSQTADLSAFLIMRDDTPATVNLAERIKNDNGQLKFVPAAGPLLGPIV